MAASSLTCDVIRSRSDAESEEGSDNTADLLLVNEGNALEGEALMDSTLMCGETEESCGQLE